LSDCELDTEGVHFWIGHALVCAPGMAGRVGASGCVALAFKVRNRHVLVIMTLFAVALWYVVWPELGTFLWLFGILLAAQLFESRFSGARRQVAKTLTASAIFAVCAAVLAWSRLLAVRTGYAGKGSLVFGLAMIVVSFGSTAVFARSLFRLRKSSPA
jgi:hypothetical protein